MKRLLSILPLFLAIYAHAQGPVETERLLENFLSANPNADYNADGTLTKQEAAKYRRIQDFVLKQAASLKLMPEPKFLNHAYGPHWRNTLDFWKAESEEPTPVLLIFHPGGFVGGDKSRYYGDPLVLACLENGISVVLANYRYVTQASFPAPHQDAARVIQYVRHHASSQGLDPERIAMSGSSAGGNMSVWLAVRDDLADPESEDPISRQSTRLTTIIGFNSQTSNDPFFIWENIYQGNDAHTSIYDFYGVERMPIEQLKAELSKPYFQTVIDEATALNHISKDDPPVFLIHPESLDEWDGKPLPPGTAQSKYAHHVAFGKFFKDHYESVGLQCKVKGINETSVEEQLNWLRKWFAMGE